MDKKPNPTQSKLNEQNDVNERMKELIRFARNKGYLTLHDISEHLSESIDNPEDIENVMNILDNLEIEIIDNEEAEIEKKRSVAEAAANNPNRRRTWERIRFGCICVKWGRCRY